MQIHQLKRRTRLTSKMIVGRGGKRGKTSGRGGKGQTARAGNKRRPELRDLIKKLPKLRGRGLHLNKSFQPIYAPVNLDLVNIAFNEGEHVTPIALVERGVLKLLGGNLPIVKILSDGEITKKVTIEGCAVSATAKSKIEKAGGTVVQHGPVKKVYVAPVKTVKAEVKTAPAKAPKAPKVKKATPVPAK